MSSPERGSRRFDLHGLRLDIHSDNVTVLRAVQSRLWPFMLEPDAPCMDCPPDAIFEIDRAATLRHTGMWGRPVYDTDLGEVRYCDRADRLFIDCGTVSVDADLGAARVTTTYLADRPESLALAAHPLLTLPLLEICKRRDMFPVHSAGLVHDDRVVFIPAASGSGKTTLAIALALSGMGFLSDDMVFLRRDQGPIRALSFPDELDITDATAAMFPETAHLVGRPTWGGRPKHQIRGEAIGLDPATSGNPALMILPVFTEGASSCCEELDASSALMELLPNVLLTEQASSAEHLQILAELSGTVPCVRLHLGTDLSGAVAVIKDLLA